MAGTGERKRPRGRPRALRPAEVGSVQAIDRGISVLAAIAASDGLTLTELAQRTGLAPSTAHRLLASLEAHRFVAQDRERGRWLIGAGAFEVGTAFVRNRGLANVGRSVMTTLMERTGETVNLGVEDDCEVVFISQIESHGTLRAFFRAGSRAPMHASGVGKALLAEATEAHVRTVVHRRGLERFTERTIVSEDDLFGDLAAIRGRGWAMDNEERTLGMRCVAAAIFNEHGEAIAGLSISGPSVRITPTRASEFGPLVRRAAAEITAIIGGQRPAPEAVSGA